VKTLLQQHRLDESVSEKDRNDGSTKKHPKKTVLKDHPATRRGYEGGTPPGVTFEGRLPTIGLETRALQYEAKYTKLVAGLNIKGKQYSRHQEGITYDYLRIRHWKAEL
jgi:hypothetical protein